MTHIKADKSLTEEHHEESKEDESIVSEAGRTLASPPLGEEVVITGMAGQFPQSDNLCQFLDNLLNKVDLVTPGNRNCNTIHPEIPKRSGKINHVEKFDAGFFGVHHREANIMDPLGRLLLERAFEAVLDSGINPEKLRGTRTGVFVGALIREREKPWFYDKMDSPNYGVTGCLASMLAQRVSYFMGLNGFAYTIDSACSTSLYTLEHAYRAIRSGKCDGALVAGMNLCLNPLATLECARLGVLSLDGSCMCFDTDANGFVRSEAISVLYLQKAKDAKRIYAQIIHAKTNCDGFKEQGVTYPSWSSQSQLFKEVCQESNVSPESIDYVEGHITGTKVGDPAEIKAIEKIYTINRNTPLLVGSIKSNIGHTEGSSGLCSVIKVLLSMHHDYLLPNINYKRPPPDIKALEDGRIVVVTDTMPWPKNGSGIVAVNNFGFGGANANLLLRRFKKQKLNKGLPRDDLPRLVCISGRTEEAVTNILDDLGRRTLDEEFVRLLQEVFRNGMHRHPFRGYIIMSKHGELGRSLSQFDDTKPLCLVFGSVNKIWLNVGEQLCKIPLFKSVLQRVQRILLLEGVDVIKILTGIQPNQPVNDIIASTVVQIALVDVLKRLRLPVDYIIGCEMGELVAAYADNALTIEQVTLCVYYTSLYFTTKFKVLNRHKLKENKIDSINHASVSTENPVMATDNLNNKSKTAATTHNSFEESSKPSIDTNQIKLLQHLKKIIPQPKQRSPKWITLLPTRSKFASAEYFVNNLVNPELLPRILSAVPRTSVVLEIGCNVANSANCKILTLDPDKIYRAQNITPLLCSLGQLYELGYNLELEKLYPKVQLPVNANTPMISPLIKWDHSNDWFVPPYELQQKVKYGYRTITIDIHKPNWAYMAGHNIDGHSFIPATGYLVMVWETFSLINELPMLKMKVAFENVKFHKVITIPSNGEVKLAIAIQRSGVFEVEELGQTVVTGKIGVPEDFQKEIINLVTFEEKARQISMTEKDVYKELRLRGYYYTGPFRGLKECDLSFSKGKIQWIGNWATFIDNMLQIEILQEDTRILYVPTTIKRLMIDAEEHMEYTKALGENHLVPVYNSKAINLIRSGGIEVRGFFATAFPRGKPQAQPVLETYTFVPLEGELTTKQAIRVIIQILLENINVPKIQIVELVDDSQPDPTLLSPIFNESTDDQPSVQTDILVQSKEPIKLDNIAVKNSKDINACSLLIASAILRKPEKIKEALQALKENGMILSREDIETNIGVTDINLDGLDIICVYKTQMEKLVLLRRTTKFAVPTVIDVTNTIANFDWLLKLQSAVKSDDNVLLFAQNESINGILGLFNCLKQEPGGLNVKCVLILDEAPNFDITNNYYLDHLKKGLSINVRKNGKWGTYRHLLLENGDTVEREHVINNLTIRGDLASLRWVEGPLTSASILPTEKTLVHVYYCALNFRDVMTASGRISNDIITKNRPEQDNVQGFEYSGRNKAGKRIMGMVNSGALASMVAADSYFMWEIPNQWSMEEAVTIPVIYSTVLYSFIVIADLKPGQSILIHSGTGGVGQAAINLALHFKCKVFTTAGTEEKRDFIKKHFPQIPETHIGNSHSVSFEHVIMKATRGRGVDIVLNSLAEEKLQTSLRCLAPGGKFLEIGKFDITRDSVIRLNSFKNSRSFHGITLDGFFGADPTVKGTLHKLLLDGLNMGFIKPLNRTVFEKDEVEQALRHMAAGKHTGKVVIKLREEENQLEAKPQMKLFKGMPKFYGDSNHCYIIVGGLGGFGLELADYLVMRGIRKLILVSRQGLKDGYQVSRIRIWESYGTVVNITTSDVTTKEGCSSVIKQANKLGPVEGLFNLAVVLHDGILENQSENMFLKSLAPKAIATQNLDIITRKTCPKLKYFVVFSSMSCGRGTAGQTNYGLANSIMERLCEERRKSGYPALAIQWGAVAEVGLLSEMQNDKGIGGTLPQSISSCLSVMDMLLTQNEPVVSSAVIANKKTDKTQSDNIVTSINNIMGLKDLRTVSPYSTLSELGMDSMMAVEINQTLRSNYGIFLTAKDIRRMTFRRLEQMEGENITHHKEDISKYEKKVSQSLYQLLPTLGNEQIAAVPIIRLKSLIAEKTLKPAVFFLPGITGTAGLFEPLASNLEFPIFSLQYKYDDTQDATIERTSKALLPHIEEKLQNTDQFELIAYSYGCIIALQVAALLEQKNQTGTLILIDGSPAVFKALIEQDQGDETLSILETNILSHLMELYIPRDTFLKHKEDISSCNTFEERVDTVLKYVTQDALYFKSHLRQLSIATYGRIKSILQYQPKFPKLHSTVKLFKPKISLIEDFNYDYKLQELCEKTVEVENFEGNHLTLLKNPKLCSAVNKTISDSRSRYKKT